MLQSALQVSNGVNGPLLELLAKEAGHNDCEAINQFRYGASLIGVLTCAGNGRPVPAQQPTPISVLQESRAEANSRIVNSGRIDRCVRNQCDYIYVLNVCYCRHADELLAQTKEDIALGRMSDLMSPSEIDINNITICPRFGVEQGMCMSMPLLQS